MFSKLMAAHILIVNVGFIYMAFTSLFPMLSGVSLILSLVLWPLLVAMVLAAIFVVIAFSIYITFGSPVKITKNHDNEN